MGDKQSGHNNISPKKLNSIHHKVVINTNKVEGIDSTDYNTSCNCETSLDVDGDGAGVGDDVDDDVDDLPFREVISPTESPRRRWVFSSVRFPHRGGGVSRKQLLFRGFCPGGSYRRK